MTRHGWFLWFVWAWSQVFFRVCSLIVPAGRRQEWRAEWAGELWQVRETCEGSAALFCFIAGALPDALCMWATWRDEPVVQAVPASRCLLVLGTLTLLMTATALSIPRVRGEFRQAGWQTPGDTSLLFLPNSNNEATPTITPERFLLWKERAHLPGIGFYQVEERTVAVRNSRVRLRIAHGTRSVWSLVSGGSTSLRGARDGLVASRRAWQRNFGSASTLEGESVRVGGRPVRVTGVADLEDSGLPGAYDAWMFDDGPLTAGLPGYVLGRFPDGSVLNPYFGFDHFAIVENPEVEVSGLAFPVAERKVSPWYTLALGLALGLLALPATTPLGFGEQVRTSGRPSPLHVVRRWSFLGLKCCLCAVLASSLALVAASVFPRSDWRWAVAARVLVSLLAALLGLRWAIHDQRSRCPICLKRLTHAARVGEPSRNFLSWNGTELVCRSGHGVMHVPAHATSWFGAQRWLALDASWQFLFAQKR